MKFDLEKTIEILSGTPSVLDALLANLSPNWTIGNETAERWSAFDVVGHLIHGEETDWIPRARIILAQGENITFEPFDRFAQFEASKDKTLDELLETFRRLRRANLQILSSWKLTEKELDLKGIHPELGEVDLRQLLATWMVHDLTHVRQIVTGLARKYESEVGVWKKYLSILE